MGEYDVYIEERELLEEEIKKIEGCHMEKFGALDGGKKTIAILLQQQEIDDGHGR